MRDSKGFNLVTVIIIIFVVSIVSGITTGIIVTNTYLGINTNDGALNEFLRAYSDIINNYYEDVDKEEMLDKAMDAMLDYLGDSYTTYLNKEEREALEQRLNSTYKGIGVKFANKTIVEVIKDSPAEKAGLQTDDVFVKVDEQDVSDYTDTEISDIIKNSGKDSVRIVVLRDDCEKEFKIDVKTLYDNVVQSTMIEDTNIGYLQVPLFSRSIADQVDSALRELEKKDMKGLILDLRNDSGGYLDEAQKMASLFLKKGKLIYSLEDKNNKNDYYDETDDKKNYPIVVLINGNSASAAEILAGALKDSYGATIVGKKSYGKGKVQQTYTMSDGSMAKYTSAKWFRPNGECIDGIGIMPDYEVEIEYVYDEEGNQTGAVDTQFNKALELLNDSK